MCIPEAAPLSIRKPGQLQASRSSVAANLFPERARAHKGFCPDARFGSWNLAFLEIGMSTFFQPLDLLPTK